MSLFPKHKDDWDRGYEAGVAQQKCNSFDEIRELKRKLEIADRKPNAQAVRKELLGYLLSICKRTLICAVSEKFIHAYEQELFNGEYATIDAIIASTRA